ncbi:unnamed protein product [Arabis nemorensis]|uniref:TIR domain-containing protein n=1 Tax=Arabis nemorensis TaxID=586526 RepID=A0A565C2Z9_9BRAS|nr:unnamed protein product [Arabis nemorensis]
MAARTTVRIIFDISEETLQCCFIPYLSDAFGRKGISLLADIHDEVNECIAFVLIFSEKYVSSKEYFDKVLKTIHQRHDKDHLVTAIFYGVSRSNVQELKGNFGKAFFEHRTSDQASQWRNALAHIASFPGHEASNNQSDCDFVEKISRDVYEMIFPKERIGVYSRMLPAIVNVLCKQQWRVRSIGLWGMPGIGKTTLAEALFDQMSGDYEATCLLQNFHETFQKKGLHRLLQEHFENLSNQKVQPRVLVVLDDVRNHLDAESFLSGLGSLSHGSLIIVTSRDEQVLSQCGVNQTYKVEGLNKREALQLFSWCAFERDVTENNLHRELSSKVFAYANGNPLSLRLYGEEMSSQEGLNQKESLFLRLEQDPPHQIMEVVKSSYYALSDNEKNILVYIALFFIGEDLERVSERLHDLGCFPEIGICRLVENSLLTISENRVEMHSMIQAVVCNIGRYPQPETDEDPKTSFKSFKRVLGTKDIEAISLDASDLDSHLKLSSIVSMYNLRFLKIYYSNLENRHKALKSLPSRLRILQWEHYPLQSLPQDFDPSNLVELSMPYSQLQRLWGGTKNLKMLKRINLSHSQNLLEVEELSEARNLEQINLCGCKNLQNFPAIHHMQKLQFVDLSGGTRIKNILQFPSNVELKFHGSSIKTILPPVTFDNKSLHEHLEDQLKSHFSDYIKGRSFPISQKRITNPDMGESPPTFKNMMCQKAIEMSRSLQLTFTNLGIWFVQDP